MDIVTNHPSKLQSVREHPFSEENPMPSISQAPWKDDPIAYLLREKFPFLKYPLTEWFTLYGEGHPDGAHPPPNDTLREDGRQPNSLADVEAYREKLEALPRGELDSLVTEARIADAERQRLQSEETERNRHFNNSAATNPDYGTWSKHAYWTIEEMVGLSLGREPSRVKWADLQKATNYSSFAKRYADRREIINRAVSMGQLWKETIPWAFLAWAERMRVDVPAGLVEAVKSLGLQIRDWKTVADELQKTVDQRQKELTESQAETLANLKEHTAFIAAMRKGHQDLYDGLHVVLESRKNENAELVAQLQSMSSEVPRADALRLRERESLLKIVIGMAVTKYNFKADALRNPATGRIASDLQRVGVPLDEDTIRKYLAEAKELLPGDPTGG